MRTPRSTSAAAAALVLSSALLLSACAGAGGSPDDDKTQLRVSLFGTFGYEEVGLFAEYEAQHPDIKIVYDTQDSESDYWPVMQDHLLSGSGAADVQGIEVGRIADVVQQQEHLWTDLRSTSALGNIDNYLEWKKGAATTRSGAVLGLGTDIGPMGICYRTDLFAAAGLPTDPAEISARLGSWDDYIEMGREFQQAAPAGSAWIDSPGGLFNAMVSTAPEIYYDRAGNLIYDRNEVVQQAFTTSATAAADQLTANLEQFADDWGDGFGSGSFATIACPSWMIGFIKGKAGDAGAGKWNVIGLPGGVGGNWGGSYLGIPRSAAHPEQAAELIAWLTLPEQQAKIFTEVGNFPSTTAAIASIGGATDDYFNGAPIGQIFSTASAAAPIQTPGRGDSVVKESLTQALLLVARNKFSTDDAWRAAQQLVSERVDL